MCEAPGGLFCNQELKQIMQELKDNKNKNTVDLARAYFNERKFEQARRKFETWLKKYPTDANAWLDYGATLFMLSYPLGGLEATKTALKLDPTFGMAYSNIGLYHQMHNNANESMKWFSKAVDNGYAEGYFNYSLAKLANVLDAVVDGKADQQDWTEAWLAYMYRFKKEKPVRLPWVKPGVEPWPMEKNNDPVMVIGEQGIGDNVMFARYFHLLPAGSSFAVPPEQWDLFPGVDCHARTDDRDHKWYVAAGSLPMYFSIEESRLVMERSRGEGIGVCWKGNASHCNDRHRSYPLLKGEMLKLGRSLVYGDGFQPSGWKETISVVEGLDTIITVDTSLAHVAGRMGKRVMLLQPKYDWDFRWGTRRSNIWYPYVESYGTWEELLKNI